MQTLRDQKHIRSSGHFWLHSSVSSVQAHDQRAWGRAYSSLCSPPHPHPPTHSIAETGAAWGGWGPGTSFSWSCFSFHREHVCTWALPSHLGTLPRTDLETGQGRGCSWERCIDGKRRPWHAGTHMQMLAGPPGLPRF